MRFANVVKEFAAQKCPSHVEDVADGFVDLAVNFIQELLIAELARQGEESVVQGQLPFNPVDIALVAELTVRVSLLIRGIY